jgi:RNA polymerase sigma factor (sigma-70 family)
MRDKKSAPANLELNPAQLQMFNEHQQLVGIAVWKYGRGKGRESHEVRSGTRCTTPLAVTINDDLAQEARIALVKAIKTHDVGRNIPLGPYAWKCIKNRCLDFLKRRPQPRSHDEIMGYTETGEEITLFEKVQARAAKREVQGPPDGGDDDYGDYEDKIYQVRYIIENSLNSIERRAVEMQQRGSTLEEIAKKLGTSKTASHRLVKGALTKIRKNLEK